MPARSPVRTPPSAHSFGKGFVYALGLGIPFVIAGLAFTKMARAVAFLRRTNAWCANCGDQLACEGCGNKAAWPRERTKARI